MKLIRERDNRRLAQISAAVAMALVLGACGGSGGEVGDSGSGNQGLLGSTIDTDQDGLTDDEEAVIGTNPLVADTDGDGLNDGFEELTVRSSPLFADTDFDGLNDGLEYNVLLTDPTAADTDFDGTDDGDEDTDNDGVSNIDEVTAGTDPIVADNNVPQADRCDDAFSSNSEWTDNCVIRRFGDNRNSSYTQGVQRILWCQGHAPAGQTIDTFSDGQFGEITDQSVRDFQQAEALAVDGVVGPDTWTALYSKLQLLSATTSAQGHDSYSVQGCSATLAQFYQEVSGIELLGWTMARFPGSADRVHFSIDDPH